jgi:IS30 family transposase
MIIYTQRPWEHRQLGNRDRFLELWKADMPIRQMARTLGISISTVWMVAKRMDLHRARTPSQAATYQIRCRRRELLASERSGR